MVGVSISKYTYNHAIFCLTIIQTKSNLDMDIKIEISRRFVRRDRVSIQIIQTHLTMVLPA